MPSNSAINIILIDALNTPQADQSYLHDQLLKFVRTQPPGYPTAIFGLSNGLYMLQGVTSDPRVLEAVIAAKTSPQKSALLENSLLGNGDTTLTENAAMAAAGGDAFSSSLANLQGFENTVNLFKTEVRAQTTLQALNTLARYVASIPGRKNLIWFSGAFPINPVPNPSTPTGSNASGGTTLMSGSVDSQSGLNNFAADENQFRQTTNLLARAQVAVYPIDARGLFSISSMDAATPGTQYARSAGSSGGAGNDLAQFTATTAAEHEVMKVMAHDTGGEAYYNANNLAKFANEAMQNGAFYYTITYTPSDTKWNGKYRDIVVNTEGQKFNLSYRRGYYADDPDEGNRRHEASALLPAHSAAGAAAMLRGAPTPTQLLISARINPLSDGSEMLLAPQNVLDEPAKATATGPFRRYRVDTVVDTTDLTATEQPDGTRHIKAAFVIFVYDLKGQRINRVTNVIEANVTPENYARLVKAGLATRQEISVPVKTTTFLRVGVQDLISGKVGALELATSSVAKLPLVAATASR